MSVVRTTSSPLWASFACNKTASTGGVIIAVSSDIATINA